MIVHLPQPAPADLVAVDYRSSSFQRIFLVASNQILTTDDGLIVESCPSLWNSLSDVATRSQNSANQSLLRHAGQMVDFPGVVVRRSEIVLGIVGCSTEPDGTVSTTLPVLTPQASWIDHLPVTRALFRGVERIALDQGARGIHCLVPLTAAPPGAAGDLTAENLETMDRGEADDFCTTRLMQQSGLEQVATVLRLEKRIVPSEIPLSSALSRMSLTAEVFPIEELYRDSEHQTVESWRINPENSSGASSDLQDILDEILANSNDLPASIRPTGARLLCTWVQRRAWIFCISSSSGLEGIAAVSGLNRTASDENSDSDSPKTLEYIGVRPKCRRQGIGGLLMQMAEDWILREMSNPDGESMVLTAYADADNEAAMALYQSNRYQQTEQYRLLYRILASTE